MIALGVRSSLRRRGRSPQSIAQSDAEGEVVVIESESKQESEREKRRGSRNVRGCMSEVNRAELSLSAVTIRPSVSSGEEL